MSLLFHGINWTPVVLAQLIVIALLAFAFSDRIGWPVSFLWPGPLMLLIVAQGLGAATHSSSLKGSSCNSLQLFTTLAWLIGLGWGLAGFYLYPLADHDLQWVLVAAAGGVSLAYVGLQHVYLRACIGSIGFLLPALAWQAFNAGERQQLAILLGIILLLLVLALMLRQFSLRAIALQCERDALLADLDRAAGDVESARWAAEEANEAKSRFLAQASHDLRQPLHAVGLFIETISAKPSPEHVAEIITRVRHSLSSLSKLFDDLLDISLLDTREPVVNATRFALRDVFKQLESDFEPIAEANGISLRFLAGRLSTETDPLLLRRVLQNLVSNALRHSDADRVLVVARRATAGVAIHVYDNGRGIPEEEQSRIFQEFVRLQSASGSKSGMEPGLGLGLSIVTRLAAALGFSVTVNSQETRGSRFTVTGLPLISGAVESLDESAEHLSVEDPLLDAGVLVVDDDTEVLEATAGLLRKWGCAVHVSEGACDVPGNIDVVVVDYELADEQSGIELIQRFRQERAQLPAVLISGNSSEQLRDSAARHELTLLHKPVRPVQLRSALLHALVRVRPSA